MLLYFRGCSVKTKTITKCNYKSLYIVKSIRYDKRLDKAPEYLLDRHIAMVSSLTGKEHLTEPACIIRYGEQMPDIIINGPAGRLEGRYSHAKSPDAPLAIILHPNPEHGGTMNNKVTYYLFQTFAARGFSTLRFNFRGVGRSQGEFDQGEGELSDAATALDWLQEVNPNAPYTWVAGFSFGAWIGMQLLMRRPEIRGFVSVAPPANAYDFSFLAPCPTSGLILQGSNDEIVPVPHSAKLAERIQAQRGISVDYREIQGANHFFGDHIEELQMNVHDHLNKAGGGNSVPINLIEAA
jgi:alpha/beta superfamily hydrolase